MGNPEILTVKLQTVDSYQLEVDTFKADCNGEPPHWHLCHRGSQIGQISIYGIWVGKSNVSPAVRREVEELTTRYRQEIYMAYQQNQIDGH